MRWIAATNRRAGGLPQTRSIAPHVERGRSWMAPEAKSEDLLYISDYYGVHVFSYPKGQYVGDIDAFGYGLCSDRAGDVFVTDAPAYQVYEYAHGSTKRLQTLYGNYVDFGPIDCSVDPTTGNLAEQVQTPDSLSSFPKRSKIRKSTTTRRCFTQACSSAPMTTKETYSSIRFIIVVTATYIGELPKGTKQFANYLLDSRIAHPGGIQFDGKRVAIEDLGSLIVYRLRFSGSKAIVVGSTSLNGAGYVEQCWVRGKTLIGPDSNTTVYFWKYPRGGSPVNLLRALR